MQVPSPEIFTRICEVAALSALVQTRDDKQPDSVATLALIRAGIELMKMDGRTPAEVAAYLRRTADALERGPMTPDA